MQGYFDTQSSCTNSPLAYLDMLERPLRCYERLRIWEPQGRNFRISLNYIRIIQIFSKSENFHLAYKDKNERNKCEQTGSVENLIFLLNKLKQFLISTLELRNILISDFRRVLKVV